MHPIPIIILNWNGFEDTFECMPSVLAQSYENFVIYLVDNGSNPEDLRLLKEHYTKHPKINLIFNETNYGFTKGNNLILKKILQEKNTPYVVLLNNDTVVDKDWLKNLVHSAKENNAHIVSSKMINYYERHLMDNAGHRMINTGEIVTIGTKQPIEEYTSSFENMGACAGAALYDTNMLRKIGVFDEFFETGYEDAELGVRANILGYKTIFEPRAIIYHKVSSSIQKIVNYDYILKIQTSVYYSYLKLMPLGVLLVSLPSFLFKYFCILIIDIVFFRKLFLKILFHSAYNVFFKERNRILESRRSFLNNHQPISSFQILKKQEFFLWFDIKRFVNDVLLKKKPLLQKKLDEKV